MSGGWTPPKSTRDNLRRPLGALIEAGRADALIVIDDYQATARVVLNDPPDTTLFEGNET